MFDILIGKKDVNLSGGFHLELVQRLAGLRDCSIVVALHKLHLLPIFSGPLTTPIVAGGAKNIRCNFWKNFA